MPYKGKTTAGTRVITVRVPAYLAKAVFVVEALQCLGFQEAVTQHKLSIVDPRFCAEDNIGASLFP